MTETQGPQRAMAIVAHPDDTEFLCGGTVARWCDEGWEVIYIVATSGDKGTRDPNLSSQELAAIREREQREAAAVLGVKEVIYLGYPDGFLEETLDLREQLVRLLRRYQPQVVVTWDGFRRNFNHRDHRVIGRVAYDAVFPAARTPLYHPEHLRQGLEPYRASELLLAGSEEPDYHVDISAYLDRKLEALRRHVSQVGDRPRREMATRLRRWHREAGKKAGYKYAESFRRLQIGGPPAEGRRRSRGAKAAAR